MRYDNSNLNADGAGMVYFIGFFAGLSLLLSGINVCRNVKESKEKLYKQKIEQEIIQKYRIDTLDTNTARKNLENKTYYLEEIKNGNFR